MINPKQIAQAHSRIAAYIKRTPILTSELLNQKFGANFFFKFEGVQKTGAFKLRGALNVLLSLKEQGNLPQKVCAFSSGNHSQGVAYAAKLLGISAKIFMPEFASKTKIQATKAYGAEVIITKTRQEAEAKVLEESALGAYFIHPYDNENLICGQGTSCFEALSDLSIKPDAIFASVGGGGWVSGSYLAAQLLCPTAHIYGAEPIMANDAAKSFTNWQLKKGGIVKLPDSPQTIADGVRTLAISERTFEYIKKLEDIIEVSEEDIIYHTQWLFNLLKVTVEPTSAMSFAAAANLVKTNQQYQNKNILILLSGGNIDSETHQKIWAKDYLLG
jgi:threo-3-hydroxy-L-aspartate ammonia-lyase